MPTERDVYMAANMMLKQHGNEAAIFAAMNADRLAERGDRAGQALWISVIKAIEVLEASAAGAGNRDEDQYGRKLRVIERDGRPVTETLIAEGLARRWDGRRRSWCD